MTAPKRYQVIRHWHDNQEIVHETNQKKTAVRRAEEEYAANLSTVAWFEIRSATGRSVKVSPSRQRREENRARWRAQFQTAGYRGVW